MAVDQVPVQQNTVWENIGLILLLLACACGYVCYRLGFKVKAKCLVIGKTTKRPCPNDSKVILGCDKHHKWKKPWAWLRHLGAAPLLDPWFYRLHVVPPSFAPMPMPVVPAPSASGASSPAQPESLAPGTRMTREVRIALWALVFAIIQASTGIIALVIGK
jgi:hypothetical protein